MLSEERARAAEIILVDGAQIRREEALDLAHAAFTAFMARSPIFDRVGTWFLGATGATAALSVSNLDKVTAALGTLGTRLCLIALTVSLLAGLVSRVYAIRVQHATEFVTDLLPNLKRVMEGYGNRYRPLDELADKTGNARAARTDSETLHREMVKAAPFFLRAVIRRGIERGSKDPLMAYRRAVRHFHWQGCWFVMQYASFVAFVLIAAVFV